MGNSGSSVTNCSSGSCSSTNKPSAEPRWYPSSKGYLGSKLGHNYGIPPTDKK